MTGKEPSKELPKESAAGNLVVRAFGPFADSFGSELAKLPPFATRNLLKLAALFKKKTTEADRQATSMRLFKQVLEEAAWADEEIIAEYLSGVLASSSKSVVSDRGVTIAALIRRLSSLELRTHYLLYAALLHNVTPSSDRDLRKQGVTVRLHCEVELEELFTSLGNPSSSWQERKQVLDHVVLGLAREDLIQRDAWWYDEGQSYLEFHPTALGAELFLWGLGSAVIDQSRLFDPALELVLSEDLEPLRTVRIGRDDELVELYDRNMYEALRRRDVDELRGLSERFIQDYPERPNGYFYSSVVSAISNSGDPLAIMKVAANLASPEQIASGLTTLDFVFIQYPSKREIVTAIASELERAEVARAQSQPEPS